jgi:tetratricopeptide (TPR) repeat protein
MEQAERLLAEATLLRNQGRGDESALKYEQAARFFDEAGKEHEAAECWHMMGVSLKHQLKRSMEIFQQAIEKYRRAGDETGVGRVYRDMAIPYLYEEDYYEALQWLRKSEQVLRDAGARAELGVTLAKIGHVFGRQKNFEEAEAKIEEGLRKIRSEGATFYEATALMHLAEVRLDQADWPEVVELCGAALKALRRDDPELNEEEVIEKYGRRSAQILGLLAWGESKLGYAEAAKNHFARSDKLINQMPEDAAEIVRSDIRYKTLRDQLK